MTGHKHNSWKPAPFDPRYEECRFAGCHILRRAPVLFVRVEARIQSGKAVIRVAEWTDAEWFKAAHEMGKQIAQELA